MERMTRWNPETEEAECEIDGVVHTGSITTRLAEYEDTGLYPEEVRGIKTAYDEVQIPYEVVATGADAARVIRLLDAEDEGRLLVLPCKVGDVVYYHFQFKNKRILPFTRKAKVKRIYCKRNSFDVDVELMDAKESGIMKTLHADDFGKTVFLTREAADKALEGMKNEL